MKNSIQYLAILLFICFQGVANELPLKIYSDAEIKAAGLKYLNLGKGAKFAPRHDGINYFVNADAPLPGEQPATYAIDQAIAKGKIIEIGIGEDISTKFLGESLETLPITFRVKKDGEKEGEASNYDVSVLAINFRTDSVYFTVGCKFEIPGQDGGKETIYFGAKDIKLNYKGGSFSGEIKIIETGRFLKNARLGENFIFELGPSTSMTFDCGKFKKFTLDGVLALSRNLAIPEDPTGSAIDGNFSFYFRADVEHWRHLILNLKLPTAYGFHLPDYPDVGFWFSDDVEKKNLINENDFETGSDGRPKIKESAKQTTKSNERSGVSNIILDLSTISNAPMGDNCVPDNWKGLYIEYLGLRLPEFFKNRNNPGTAQELVSFKDIVIGNSGLYGAVGVEKEDGILKLADGQIGEGWDVSVKMIEFERKAICAGGTEQYKLSLGGEVRPPAFSEDEPLIYEMHASTAGEYLFNVKLPKDRVKFDVFSGLASISLRNIQLQVLNGDNGKKNVKGFLTVDGCIDIVQNSGGFNFGLGVQGLTFTTDKPFIKEVTGIQLGCNNSKGIGLGFGGFEINVSGNPGLQVDNATDKIKMDFDIGVALGDNEDGQGFSAEGKFLLLGHVAETNRRFFMVNDSLKLTGLKVDGNFGVIRFWGDLETFDDDRGKGFDGFMGLKVSMSGNSGGTGGVSAEVRAIFGKKDDYKYWYLDAGVEMSVPLGFLSLKGVVGGGYKNVAVTAGGSSLSGFSFKPEKGVWGFRLGVMLGLSLDFPAQLNGMLEVVGRSGGGIKTVFLASDVNFNMDAKENQGLSGFKNMVQNSYRAYMQFNELLASEKKGEINANNEKYRDGISGAVFGFRPVSSSNSFRLGAGSMIWYDVDNGELNAIVYPDIDIKLSEHAQLNSKGVGLMHFSRSKWYIHLGRSQWDERLGIVFALPGVRAEVNAYVMLGHGINTELPIPRVPDAFSDLFKPKSQPYCNACSNVSEGKGLALGAAITVDIISKFPVGKFSAYVNAGAGFDFILVKVSCPEGWGDGQTSFRGEGQLYGYFNAGIKWKSKDVCKLGAGFRLAAGGFQPTWADGKVKVFVKVIGIKFNMNVKFHIGNKPTNGNCALPPVSADVEMMPVASTYPEDKATEVARNAKIKIFFKGEDAGVETEDGDQKVTDMEDINDDALTMYTVTSTIKYDNTTSINGSWTYTPADSKGGRQAVFTPSSPLPANKLIQVNLKMGFKDDEGELKNENDESIYQTINFSFKTTSTNKVLLTAENSLPYNGQYSVFKGHSSSYVEVDKTELAMAKRLCAACKYNLILTEKESGNKIETENLQFNVNTGRVSFDKSSLGENKVYDLQLEVEYPEGDKEIMYKNHFFRVSNHNTFAEKIKYIEERKEVISGTTSNGIPIYKLEFGDPDFEGFSEKELKSIITHDLEIDNWQVRIRLFSILIPFNSLGKDSYSLIFKQNAKIQFKDGLVQRATATQAKTLWDIEPYTNYVLKHVPRITTEIPRYDGGVQKVKITYKEEKENEREGYLTYQADAVDFNNLRNREHLVQVKCKRGGKDSDPIVFETTIYENQEKQSVPFALADELSLKLKVAVGVDKTDSIIANLTPPLSTFKTSGFKSILDCPTSANISIQGVEKEKYRLVVINEPRPHHPPFIRVNCAAKTVDYTPLLPENVSYGNPREGVRNPTDVDNPQFLESFEAVQIYAYEDEYSALPQKVTSAVIVTLKNGRTCILPVGKAFNECTFSTNYSDNSISACEDAELNGGTGSNTALANKKFTNKWSVSTLVATPVAACGFNNDAGNYLDTLYSESSATTLITGALMSAVYGNTRQIPESGYYKVKDKGIWILVKDGEIKETGSCAELDPYISQECSIASNVNGDVYRQIKYTFFTNPDKLTPYVLPTGLSIKLANGQQVGISAGVSEYIHLLGKNEPCIGLDTDNDFGSDGDAFDCKQIPAKPVVKISKTQVKVGEPITLSIENCAGEPQWIGANGKGNNITIYPTEAKNYSAICEVNGCHSPESDKVGITLESFTISYSTANPTNNQLVCYGSDVTLTANGCGGTPKWEASGSAWTAEGQNVVLENFTQDETYSAVCETADGMGVNSRNQLSISAVPIPSPVSITSDKGGSGDEIFICTNQLETITLSTISTSACEAGTSLMWYYNTGTSSNPNLTHRPQAATDYYAVCQKSNALGTCESVPSEIISVKTISLKQPEISIIPKKEGVCKDCKVPYFSKDNGVTTVNMCQFESVNLSYSGCYANENPSHTGTLEWRKLSSDGVETVVTNLSNLTESASYKVLCKLEHCESTWSDVVNLIFCPKPPTPSITSSANGFVCTKNGSGTIALTASECGSNQSVVWFRSGTEVGRLPSGNLLILDSEEDSGSYTAQCMDGADCKGDASASVNVDLRTIPDDPSAEHGGACDGQDITIGAAGCSGDYLWSNQLTVDSQHIIERLSIGTHDYSVRCRVNSCESGNTTVKAVIHPYPVISGTAEVTICEGMEVQLNAKCDLGNIIWPSGVSSDGKVSPDSTTNYVVACESNGCRTEYTIKVNVNPNPAAPSMGGEITVCDNVTIEATCQQGMQVAWKDAGFIANNHTNWNITETGKYEAICKNPNTGCKSGYSSKQVNVYYTPSVSISQKGGTDICSGQEVTLTASCSGNTFSWSDNLGSEKVISVKPGETTTYKAYCSESGHCLQEASIEIKVRQTPSKPTMTGPSEACQSATLEVSCGTNINVAWSTSETGTESYESLKVTSTGTYTANCYNNHNGCRSESSSQSMTIHSQPTLTVPTAQSICEGQKVTLTASFNGSNFKWEGFTDGESSITVSPTSTNTYTAKCSNNGYCEVSEKVTVTVKSKPSSPSLSGSTSFCDGSSTTLSASCGSGASAKWENSGTSTLTVTDGGTYYAYCEQNDCGSSTSSRTVTEDPAPTIKTNEKQGCGDITFTVTCTNGTGNLKRKRLISGWEDLGVTSKTYTDDLGLLKGKSIYGYCSSSTCGEISKYIGEIETGSSPSAPTITSSHTTLGKNRTSVTINSNCGIGTTAKWNTDSNNHSISVSKAGSYNVQCYKNGDTDCISGVSNTITITQLSWCTYVFTVKPINADERGVINYRDADGTYHTKYWNADVRVGDETFEIEASQIQGLAGPNTISYECKD